MYHERDVGETEHRPLFIGLPEEADDLGAAGLRSHPLGLGLLDVPWGDQVQDDRHQPGVLDPFVLGGRVVDGDPRPEELSQLEAAARRVEPLVQLVDLVGEEARDRGAEDAGELGLKQVAQGAVERLAIAGVVGVEPRGGADAPSQRPPFFAAGVAGGWTRARISSRRRRALGLAWYSS